MTTRSTRLAISLLLVAVAACSGGDPGTPGPKPGDTADPNAGASSSGGGGMAPTGPTFHENVEPILHANCQGCHVAGGIAPFPLVTYDDAKANGGGMKIQTGSRAMPPFGAQNTSECTPPLGWKDDMRLSDADIATIAAWVDGGMPEGDPSKALPPPSGPAKLDLASASKLTPATPYSLEASKDTFRCFVLDPKITQTTYLDGTHVIPGNPTIVHHALVFAVPAGASVPGDQYDCFGGSMIDGASLVALWAPGAVPNQLPSGVGIPLDAGTRFVMQIHYHPHANATSDPDATTFEYHTTNTAPTYIAQPKLIGNFSKAVDASGTGLEPGADDPGKVAFVIPPNVAAHVETMRFQASAAKLGASPVHILSVGAHMHLAGRDEKLTLTHAGASSCLLQVPQWSFNWQRGYQYDAAIDSLPILAADDVLEVRCTYDNSTNNVDLASARTEAGMGSQPLPITLGESTMDEMCLGFVTFVTKAP